MTVSEPDGALSQELNQEQNYLDELLALVDSTRERLNRKLAAVRQEADTDDFHGLLQRDREIEDISQRLDTLHAAELGLMFGRIDVEDPEPENPVSVASLSGSSSPPADATSPPALDRRYIGRIGLHDSDATMRTLLMDWRAPQARPFYLATTMRPEGVHVRRHITVRGRRVASISEEKLQGSPTEPASLANVAQETALLAAINRARTERMGDIVETIGAEQDAIIRSTYRGVTVVQGAPGTGKTAVALHRAAYLLYTWREQLAKTGVLLIGPNKRFLDYISAVLPALGETGVVLATPGTLLPHITTVPETDARAREVKGSIEMLHILKCAIHAWQTVPEQPRHVLVDGVEVELTPGMVRQARAAARRSRKPHNHAQAVFIQRLIDALATQIAEVIGTDPQGGENLLSAADQEDLRAALREDAVVTQLVEEFWPQLDPQQVLTRLYTEPAEIAWEYDAATVAGLRAVDAGENDSEAGGGCTWSSADAPLLDELADMLGMPDDSTAAQKERDAWLDKIAEAQEALDILTGSASQDLDDGFAPEVLMAYDVLDAETLAKRQRVRDSRSTAERAASDARWAFGHVIVDEAQELSPMDWRMVFRRSPNRWMTVVGDPAQTGNPAGVECWSEALEPFVQQRWQLHELTVNYRTPADVMAVAQTLLPLVAPDQRPAVALRATGSGVRRYAATDVLAAISDATAASPGGLVGVVGLSEELRRVQEQAGAVANEVMFIPVDGVKGLEFDEVVVLHPDFIAAASVQGYQDLYVTLTRATQGLSVVGEAAVLESSAQ